MARTAVILTTYNRPTLVQDAIRSVLEQTDQDIRLIIMDDGCNTESRDAIRLALSDNLFVSINMMGGQVRHGDRWSWWRGPQRDMASRKSFISYSHNINLALNYLLLDEKYVCYLCDDDQYFPESIGVRADFLDAHPDVHVVYGRSRSVQYGLGGYNTWSDSDSPKSGRFYPRPTGERIMQPHGLSARHYFKNGEVDPETSLPYVEEAFFIEGFLQYGKPGMIDHNSFLHRRECLTTCRKWPVRLDGYTEYWGVANSHGVGDAAFLTLLGEAHEFYGIPEWVVTKKYHAKSDGCCAAEIRE